MVVNVEMKPVEKILVVDDDPDVRDSVGQCLKDAGYQVWAYADGSGVCNAITDKNIDLVMIEPDLPNMDGLMLTRKINEKFPVGVIILSRRDETIEKIIGLEVGADDYLAKPFDPPELLARVRSVLRRLPQNSTDVASEERVVFSFEGWHLDVNAHTLTSPKGVPVKLTSGTFNLLKVFIEHPNRVLSPDQLLDITHVNHLPTFGRGIAVCVGRIRKMIESNPKKPQFIKTIRNNGYIFLPKVAPL